jgi:hypothetical protein
MNVRRKALRVLAAAALATAGIAMAPTPAQAADELMPCDRPQPAGTLRWDCLRSDTKRKTNMESAATWDGKTVTITTYANSWGPWKHKLCSKVVYYSRTHKWIGESTEHCATLKNDDDTRSYSQEPSSDEAEHLDYIRIHHRRK